MPRLDSLRIAGYKSIRDQTVELQPLNLLIGANGAGKSNFIGVFRFLSDLLGKSLQITVAKEGGADRILFFGRKRTSRLAIDLRFPRGGYSIELVPTAVDRFVFGQERINFDGDGEKLHPVDLGSGHQETALADLRDRIIQTVQSWTPYHFHDTSAEAKVKQTGDLNDNAALRRDAGNLAAFLYRLQETQPASFRNIVDVIRMVAPFFDSFNLRPNPPEPGDDPSRMAGGRLRRLLRRQLALRRHPAAHQPHHPPAPAGAAVHPAPGRAGARSASLRRHGSRRPPPLGLDTHPGGGLHAVGHPGEPIHAGGRDRRRPSRRGVGLPAALQRGSLRLDGNR